jgi:hypothetical protein
MSLKSRPSQGGDETEPPPRLSRPLPANLASVNHLALVCLSKFFSVAGPPAGEGDALPPMPDVLRAAALISRGIKVAARYFELSAKASFPASPGRWMLVSCGFPGPRPGMSASLSDSRPQLCAASSVTV